MSDQHPRCPACNGLLKHERADILGPERVHCILCSWELVRPAAPKDKTSEVSKTSEVCIKPPVPGWVTEALSVKTLIKITVSERSSTMTPETSNNLSTLNDHLFSQLARLSAAKGDKLKEEIERTRAMSQLSNSMIENAKLALEAQRCLGGKTGPAMLQVGAPK